MTDETHGQPYRLLDTLDGIEVPAGTSVLVTAPGSTGTEFLLELLGQGRRDGDELLVLTTDSPAGEITADIEAMTGDVEGDSADGIRIIDCQTDPVDTDSVVTQNVNTPRNLTDIGIGFKEAFDEFETAGVERVRFGLLSLSVILSYVDQETVYRFCQTLTRGIEQEGALGLFLLNIDAHDEGTINTLQRAFDRVLTVEPADGERVVRMSDADGGREERHSLTE